MFETDTYNDPHVLDPSIRRRWRFVETNSAAAVLQAICPEEWEDLVVVLEHFALNPPYWMRKGGNRGDVAIEIDGMFGKRGWVERRVDLKTRALFFSKHPTIRNAVQAAGVLPAVYQEGYLVDNFKGRVALDVEWVAKDGNLDRDFSAYRAWYDAGVISAAVVITQDRRALKALAKQLWAEYQATIPKGRRTAKLPIDLDTSTTTNFEKATLRVRRGGMGTCPVLVVGAVQETWNGQPYYPIPK